MSQKRYAYLIGANGPREQNVKPLQYAEKDIERLKRAFLARPCGFSKAESIIAKHPYEALAGLEPLANACEHSDLLVVHFSGHAYVSGGHLYLICNETNIERKLFTSTAIDINSIKDILNQCRARHKLLVLDCCHAAAAHDGGTWRGDQDLEYALKELRKGSASVILSACASGKRTRELDKLELDHEHGAGFLSWALASACSEQFAEVSQGQALSLTDIWSWLPKVLDETNKDLSKDDQVPAPRLLSERELGGDDEIWFTSRRREALRIAVGAQDEQKQREELAILEQEPFLQRYCSGADVEDFDGAKVVEYAEKQRGYGQLPTGNIKELCKRLGLASSVGTPRRAALLAFHKVPSMYMHSALVRAIARTSSDGSYVREEIEGSLSDQVENTLQWIIINLRTISENVGAGKRVDRCEIPREALRELVVNAIVHRDYEANESVHVKITPKQLIITNPGKLDANILQSDPPFSYEHSHPHNPLLLKVLSAQHWAEGNARGFEIVLEEFKKYGLPLPEIKNLSNGLVQVIIQRPDLSSISQSETIAREEMPVGSVSGIGVPIPAQAETSSDTETPSPIWNVPYRRNQFFTGREEVLTRLHENLTNTGTATLTQTQAIAGLGGIGKTQIALEYAYRYRETYRSVLWVRAATRETLIGDFVALAGLLHLPERVEQDQTMAVAAVKHWLASHDDWLLILDNADELAMVSEFLPPTSTGHLLLTTRAQAMGQLAQRIEIEKMQSEEGVLFLLRRANIREPSASDRAKATEIVQVMDGLPLALDQAGAYIEETGCGLASYLTLYQTQPQKLLGRRGSLKLDYPDSVAKTWSLSFEKVRQANSAAADLLRLCAFLAADAIPEALITDGASQLGKVLLPVATDPFQLNEALEVLGRYSLLRRNPATHTLSMHRLVQTVLKDSMNAKTQRQWASRTVQVLDEAFPDVSDVQAWPSCENALPHALACAELIADYALTEPSAARLLNQTAYYLDEHARYVEAEPLYQRALAIRQQVLGAEHPDTAQSLNNLAMLYRAQGKYEQAEPLYQRALAIREQVLGSEKPDTAQSLNNLALLYHTQGKYAQAEPLYQRALAIREQVLGSEHPDTAQSLNNLALLYHTQGKYAQAEPLYQRSLAILERVLGIEHPNVATSLHNLALLYQEQGKYQRAEPLYQRALAIYEQVLGAEHPNTASSLNNLAELYRTQGKYEQAELLLQRALAIREQVLGAEHPDTTTSLNNLAGLYSSLGKYAEAEVLYQQATEAASLGTRINAKNSEMSE